MIPFLLIFFIAIFGFGNTYYILGYDSMINGKDNFSGTTFPYGIIYSYKEGIGQFNTSIFPE